MEDFDPQILKSWDFSVDEMPEKKYLFHKMFPHGEDIIVSICEIGNIYEIRSSAEARTAGPADSVDGVANTLPEAIKIAETECRWWDEYIESYWNKKSR